MVGACFTARSASLFVLFRHVMSPAEEDDEDVTGGERCVLFCTPPGNSYP